MSGRYASYWNAFLFKLHVKKFTSSHYVPLKTNSAFTSNQLKRTNKFLSAKEISVVDISGKTYS